MTEFVKKLDVSVAARELGYLTGRRKADGWMFQLTVPNMEIRDIFRTQILDLFRDRVAEAGAAVREFCSAL